MDETLKGVLCPCCGKLLCALELNPQLKRWNFTKGSPELKHDRAGLYMKCPACRRRAAFVAIAGSATPFELSPLQDCTQLS